MTYTFGEKFGVLILVVFMALIGGLFVGLVNGFTFPAFRRFKGYTLKTLLPTKLRITPILGMILFGCIARNFFGSFMTAFPNDWAQYIRSCTLAIVLTGGGMRLTFKGKGVIVFLMSFVPLFCEATTFALIGMGIFGMPIEVSYAMGFALGSVAPSIVAQQTLRLDEMGYGRSKHIAVTLIAACPLDNITNLICFGICNSISFQLAATRK